MTGRPSTPPRDAEVASRTQPALTPEQIRRTEESRLKAKALREQHDASIRSAEGNSTSMRTPSGYIAGQKRPHSSIVSHSNTAINQRDARISSGPPSTALPEGARKPLDDIHAAKKFTQYVEYDFSKMTDTKGGFLTAEDDPHNKVLHAPTDEEQRPAHMTLKEWERHQLLKRLREAKSGPFEPGLSAFRSGATAQSDAEKGCRECGLLEIDWNWLDVFGVRVCSACKEKHPEQYSLLTKTEARTDYLLTDPELKDEELLPRLERPNPHKSTWNSMQLFLRFQVEEYAFSEKKWGSAEALDAEFEQREKEKKRRKEEKFKAKLMQLKKTTRVESFMRRGEQGRGEGQFGDRIRRRGEKHEHEWGRTLTNEEGLGSKKCVECGMEVEELEF